MFLASPWSWLAERQISSVPFNVGIEKDEGSVLNWSHWWCSVDGDVGHHPAREEHCSWHCWNMFCCWWYCSRHSSLRVQGKEHLLLLKSLILKGGYKAEVGSNQLKLHFHSALHAKPLKALKKILEAVQHKIALAHGSKKQTSCLDLKIENLQDWLLRFQAQEWS